MVYISSENVINLGGVYFRLHPILTYFRDVLSRVGDPDIGVVGIIDNPLRISHWVAYNYDSFPVELQDVLI